MSKRHPGYRRVRHTQQASPDDAFLEKTVAAGNWIRAHQNMVLVSLVVVAVAFGAVFYFRAQDRSVTAMARDQLEVAHGLLIQEDEEGAKASLVEIVERYGGTVHGSEARLLLGELYLRAGETDQALVVLEPLGESPDSPLELQAAVLLAVALEQAGEAMEAERLYLDFAEKADLAYQNRQGLEAAARLRADREDLAGAAELYRAILATYEENDPGRDVFVMRLQEMETRLGM